MSDWAAASARGRHSTQVEGQKVLQPTRPLNLGIQLSSVVTDNEAAELALLENLLSTPV